MSATKKSPKKSLQKPSSIAKISAVAGFIDFELHTLGWKAFQDLCATIMSAILGQKFQIFSPTKDEGINGYFKGQWDDPKKQLSGSFTVQSKSTSKVRSTLSKSMLKNEFAKAAALAQAGDADIYVLMTNHRVTTKSEKAIRKELQNHGIKHVLIHGYEWICKQITEVPALRRMVPRIYGLGDLSQIIDHRAYAQAESLFQSRQDDLMKFVPTDAYRQCGKALSDHGIVLIIGEPGSGKTTIADLLALSAADEWGIPTVVVNQPEDFQRHWNPEDPKQLFWIDDAFGPTQLDTESVEKWNKVLPQAAAAIRRGARVIMTSRDYIYRSAEDGLKESITKGILSSKIVIRIEDITAEEKKGIIYNHLKYGNQPQEMKSRIKRFLDDISESNTFQPEIARRLGTTEFTQKLELTREGLQAFFEKPEEFLIATIKNLGTADQAAIALGFMNNGSIPSPVRLQNIEEEALTLLGCTKADVTKSLNIMKDTFFRLEFENDEQIWKFKHPTIRDAYGKIVARNPELLDIYLAGTPTSNLLREVTCGYLGAAGVSVVIPTRYFKTMAHRLREHAVEGWREQIGVWNFLARRCNSLFHREMFENEPTYLEQTVKFGRLWERNPQIVVFRSLFDQGLISEELRRKFAERCKEVAVEWPDGEFWNNSRLNGILNDKERLEILTAFEENVLDNIQNYIEDRVTDYDPEYEPEDSFEDLTEAMNCLQMDLDESDHKHILRKIDVAMSKIDSAIDDLTWERNDQEDDTDESLDDSGENHDDEVTDLTRSIFSDVDT